MQACETGGTAPSWAVRRARRATYLLAQLDNSLQFFLFGLVYVGLYFVPDDLVVHLVAQPAHQLVLELSVPTGFVKVIIAAAENSSARSHP